MIRLCNVCLVFILCLMGSVYAANPASLTKPSEKNLISLSFQDIPVRVLLDVLARAANKNIILDDAIQGSMTLTLRDVTFSAALDSILHMQNLVLVEYQGIWHIKPHDKEKKAERAPLPLRIVSVKHMDVQTLAEKITQSKSALLSDKGYVIPDLRQKRLLIYEQTPYQQRLLQFVQTLDQPTKQIRIEARIVTLDQGSDEALGIRWASSTPSGASTSKMAGSLEALANSSDIVDNLHVNLPIADASGRLAYRLAKLNSRHILDLELSALEKEDKAEVIASPSVLTLDRSTALIEQGTEIPYVESASSGATSVVFKKAVLSLAVTPEIAANGQVTLDLNLTQDTQGKTVSTPTGPAVSINAQTMQTKISIPSGQTLVLGGIYQKSVVKHESKVPFLGDIRWLGTLFKQTRYEHRKRELMIFVTPTITTN